MFSVHRAAAIGVGRGGRGLRLTVVSLASVALLGGTASVSAGAGAAPPVRCTITGTPGPDILRGTPGPDVICGLGDRDILLGAGGDDVLVGGRGDDVLLGGPGNDRLLAGPGDDLLVDREGTNELRGGAGAQDRCIGTAATTFAGCELTFPRSSTPPAAPAGAAQAPSAATGAPAPTGPYFVESASTVTVGPADVVVRFQEAGLPAGGTVDIAVTVDRTTRLECRDPGSGTVLLDTSSTASATEQASYTADANGVIDAMRTLSVAPGSIAISGWDCQASNTVVVTLRDVTTGASLTVTA